MRKNTLGDIVELRFLNYDECGHPENDDILAEVDQTLAEVKASRLQNEKTLAEIDALMARNKEIHQKFIEKHRVVLNNFKQSVASNQMITLTVWGRGNNGDAALCLLSKELSAIAAETLPIPENQKKHIEPNFFIKDWYADHGVSYLNDLCEKIMKKYIILLDEDEILEKVETFQDLVVLVKTKFYEEL